MASGGRDRLCGGDAESGSHLQGCNKIDHGGGGDLYGGEGIQQSVVVEVSCIRAGGGMGRLGVGLSGNLDRYGVSLSMTKDVGNDVMEACKL